MQRETFVEIINTYERTVKPFVLTALTDWLAARKIDRSNWDLDERNRIISALHANDWKRQNTAQQLGISRKVLWEKMRKYQISDGEPEVPASI